jgi:hypothetical protein
MSLEEALERALKAYDRERLHPAPSDVMAQNIGYKNANSGTALSALASLRYFGLLSRPKEGFLAVSKEVEAYKFAPEEALRRSLLVSFLKRPALYADLLEKFASGLPSDATLRYELIQRGFAPQAADGALAAFRRSVDFACYYDESSDLAKPTPSFPDDLNEVGGNGPGVLEPESEPAQKYSVAKSQAESPTLPSLEDSSHDRIPVRLPGGRRAWLVIPSLFYKGDKVRLKAQIDLLLTQEDEESIDAEDGISG